MQRQHVGVAQPRHRLGLALEAAARLRALGDERVHHLDRHLAAERRVLGAIDRRHARPAPASRRADSAPASGRRGRRRRAVSRELTAPDGAPAPRTLCARSAALLRAVGVDERDVGGAARAGAAPRRRPTARASASALAPAAGRDDGEVVAAEVQQPRAGVRGDGGAQRRGQLAHDLDARRPALACGAADRSRRSRGTRARSARRAPSSAATASSSAFGPGRSVVGERSRSRRLVRTSALRARAAARAGRTAWPGSRRRPPSSPRTLSSTGGERRQHQHRHLGEHRIGLEPLDRLEPVDACGMSTSRISRSGASLAHQLERLFAVAAAQAEPAGVAERRLDQVRDGVLVLADDHLLQERHVHRMRTRLTQCFFRVTRMSSPTGSTVVTSSCRTCTRCRSSCTRASARATRPPPTTACRTSSSTCCSAAPSGCPTPTRSTTPSRRSAARSTPRPAATTRSIRSRCTPRRCCRGLALFGEIFRTPAFADVDVERRIVLEEMLEDHDEDGRLVNIDDLARARGLARSSARLSHHRPLRERRALRRRRRAPPLRVATTARATWCWRVSGAVEHDDIMRQRWRPRDRRGCRRASALEVTPPPETQTAPRFLYVRREGSQTNVQILFRALPRDRPRLPGADRARPRRRRRHVDAAAHAASSTSWGSPTTSRRRSSRSSTPGCTRSTAPARTSTCRRWCARRSRVLTRLRDEPPTAGRARQGAAPLSLGPRGQLRRSRRHGRLVGRHRAVLRAARRRGQGRARAQRSRPRRCSEVAQRLLRPERLTVACVGMLTEEARDARCAASSSKFA